MAEEEPFYKILSAYRSKEYDTTAKCWGGSGLIVLIIGVIADSTPISIVGASGIGLATVGVGLDYMCAYFEARLDYLKNNKFTKLEKLEKED